MIDEFIKEGPGFAELERMVRDAVLWGRVQLAYVSDTRDGGELYSRTVKEPGHIMIEIILGLLEQTSVPAGLIEQTLCAVGGSARVPMFKRFVSSCRYDTIRSTEDVKCLLRACEQKGVNVSKLILAEDGEGECSLSLCKAVAAQTSGNQGCYGSWVIDILSMLEPYAGSWQPRADPVVASFIGPGEEIVYTFKGLEHTESKIEAIDRGIHKFKFYVCTMRHAQSGAGEFGIVDSTNIWNKFAMSKDGYIRGKQLHSLNDGAEVLMVVDMDTHTLTVALNDAEGMIIEDKLPSSVVPFAKNKYVADKIILTRVLATGGQPG